MCGRATLAASGEELREVFDLAETPVVHARWNVAPTQPIAAIRRAGVLEELRWGLVPFFSGGPDEVHGRFINARAETVRTLPAFRDAFARKRCLVVVDGFYEWLHEGKQKRPFHIRRPDRKPFALAGVWDEWRSKDGEVVPSCAVVTCDARGVVAPLHDRMPVLLDAPAWATWLRGEPDEAAALLAARAPALETVEVGATVNDVRHEGPECLEPPRQRRLL